MFPNGHLHANAADTRARLDVGFKLHPKGYEPTVREQGVTWASVDLDLEAMDPDQEIDIYLTVPRHLKMTIFEPHMHAAGVRMCLEAIWGQMRETLNCVGYDHSWVRVYTYADDAAPLLPKGTIPRLVGHFNNSPTNPNVTDPRNWSGAGMWSVDQMLIKLARGIYLSDEQFGEELAGRRGRLRIKTGISVVGLPPLRIGRPPERECRRPVGGEHAHNRPAPLVAGIRTRGRSRSLGGCAVCRHRRRPRPAAVPERAGGRPRLRGLGAQRRRILQPPDYFLDDLVLQRNNGAPAHDELLVNKAPVLEVDGGTTRRAKTGRPLTLTARTSDDGLLTPAALAPTDPERSGRVTKNAARGLRLAWFVYRGAGQVTFEPEQFRAWEDTREGSDSPWAPAWTVPPLPPDGKWEVRATFSRPGTYVLRWLAHDGGLTTTEDMTVVVAQ